MSISQTKLYSLLSIACLAGYGWVYYNLNYGLTAPNSAVEVCIIKHVTGLPCPSCGSTRSVVSLMQGDVVQSLLLNPMGLLIAAIMLVVPIWILFDLVKRKKSLHQLYCKIENKLTQPQIAVPLILLVVFNWIWNITKGL